MAWVHSTCKIRSKPCLACSLCVGHLASSSPFRFPVSPVALRSLLMASSVCAAPSAWIPCLLLSTFHSSVLTWSSARSLRCCLPVCAPRPLSGGCEECFSLPDPVIWLSPLQLSEHGALPCDCGHTVSPRPFSRAGTSTQRGCCLASKIPGKRLQIQSVGWAGTVWMIFVSWGEPSCPPSTSTPAFRSLVPSLPRPALNSGHKGRGATVLGIRLGF